MDAEIVWAVRFSSETLPGYPRALQVEESISYDTSYLSIGRHRRSEDHCIFQYVLSGEHMTWRGRQEYAVPAGHGFLNIINDPQSGYAYPDDATEPCRFVWFGFSGGAGRQMTRSLIDRCSPVFQLPATNPALSRLLAYGSKGWRSVEISPVDAAEMVLGLLLALARVGMPAQRPSSERGLAERARLAVLERFADDLDVSSLADELGVSREHLSRVFRREAGRSLREYWVEVRLHKACQLLKRTSLPVAEVARRVGYSGVGNFSRAFRKRMQLTPTAFRRHGSIPLLR